MPVLKTSENFAAAAAAGTDWRDTSQKVLESLSRIRTDNDGFTLGFLYVTDELVPEIENILDLFRSVLGIRHWVGAVAPAICITGREYVGEPAISVMIGRLSREDFRIFSMADTGADDGNFTAMQDWIDVQRPFLALAHGSHAEEEDLSRLVSTAADETGAFLTGGITPVAGGQSQIADHICSGGLSGVLFGRQVSAVTMKAQGCIPLGAFHEITGREGHRIRELDGRRALDVFAEDLKLFARAHHPDQSFAGPPDHEQIIVPSVHMEGAAPTGEIHAAFPVSGSDDSHDFMVRNIIGIDPDEGSMLVRNKPEAGHLMGFVRRDRNTEQVDLSKNLLALRERVIKDHGAFHPKGAVFISGGAPAGENLADTQIDRTETALVQEILGDVPLTGFYADGEISNHRLYGYTSVLILFM